MSTTATTPPPAAAEPARRAYPRGFTIIDNRIITDYCPQIGIAGLALYAVLSKYADNVTRQCYPSIRTLSRCLGISPRRVLRAIQVLEEAGLVQVTRARTEQGRHHVNVYTLLSVPSGLADATPVLHDVQHPAITATTPLLHDVQQGGVTATTELYSVNYTQLNKRESERGSESELSTPTPAPSSQDNDAIKAYRELCGRTPNSTQRAAISETVTDLSHWAEVVRQWVLSGYRKQNVAGMLDWYTQGIPQRGGSRNGWSGGGGRLGFSGQRSGESQTSRYQETPEERARFDAEWEALRREAQERAAQEAANQTTDG